MAFSSGFFDAINNDRTYSSTQFGEMFDGLITDGIYSTIGNAFAVVPGSGVQIKVRSGRAWFNKTWSVNTADLPIDLEVPDLLLSRIDAVILEVDTRVVVRNNSIKVITGTPNVNPVKPTLIRVDGLYQYPLAWITVDKNVSSISATKIENNIGKDPTPFVTGILKSVDITELWTQWNGQFDEWFADVQSQLSGDIAGNLLHEIQGKVSLSDRATIDEARNASSDTKWMTPSKTNEFFIYRKATDAEITNGSNILHWVNPSQVKSAIISSAFNIYKWKAIEVTVSKTVSVPSDIAKDIPAIILAIGGGGGGGGGASSAKEYKNNSGSSSYYWGYAGGGGGAGGAHYIDRFIFSSALNVTIGTGGIGGKTVQKLDGTSVSGIHGSSGGNTILSGCISKTIIGGGGGNGGVARAQSTIRGGNGGGGGSVSSGVKLTSGGGGGSPGTDANSGGNPNAGGGGDGLFKGGSAMNVSYYGGRTPPSRKSVPTTGHTNPICDLVTIIVAASNITGISFASMLIPPISTKCEDSDQLGGYYGPAGAMSITTSGSSSAYISGGGGGGIFGYGGSGGAIGAGGGGGGGLCGSGGSGGTTINSRAGSGASGGGGGGGGASASFINTEHDYGGGNGGDGRVIIFYQTK